MMAGSIAASRCWGSSILARVAVDPELRYTASGKAVLDLALATTASGSVTYHTVILWERAAG